VDHATLPILQFSDRLYSPELNPIERAWKLDGLLGSGFSVEIRRSLAWDRGGAGGFRTNPNPGAICVHPARTVPFLQ
jgi:hypothetical protein